MICVGSGDAPLDGWINTDIGWRARIWLDITRPWGVKPGSVRRLYADNVIEHLTLPHQRAFYQHACQALEPGGRIRLVTPDIGRTARIYLDHPETAERHLERHRRAGYAVDHTVDLLRITFCTCGHERGYMHDLDSLRAELESAGFVAVERHEVGTSDDPSFQGLERRSEQTEVATSLAVEATRH